MIASDRVRLDGVIHQWEEKANYAEVQLQRDSTLGYAQGKDMIVALCRQHAAELRAVLLVLGDARPQDAVADDRFERHSCGCVFDKREPMRGYVCPEHFSTFGPPKP